MPLRSGFQAVPAIDRRVSAWIASLATLAVLNVVLWVWIARTAAPHNPYTQAQLLLSGVYVAVCGFRSLFPRVDLERVCMWDTWLSGISLGRTLATIAELCFAAQCALFVQRLSELTATPQLATVAHLFVPLALIAEVFCWYAVLSLNHIGHAMEELLWAVLMLMLAGALGAAAPGADGAFGVMLLAGSVIYGIGATLTLVVDVRMYLRRWRQYGDGNYLELATGLRDCQSRRHPTLAWNVWREEVPWMTVYFSVGVWTSLAMVLLH